MHTVNLSTPVKAPQSQIGLIDCNAFYCSAEILFRPELREKAVVVASNNDGCVVSRTDAAKRLGIKMGEPVFKIMHLVESGQLHLFSSNYPLYQALSDRVMATIATLSPRATVYSIDESFVDLTGIADLQGWADNAKATIERNTGIPVGIGIAPTKTLAKLANWAAKRWKQKTGGIVVMMDEDRQQKLLRYAPVDEVWGVGRKISQRLKDDHQIATAWQLATADHKQIRRHFGVTVERTARELTGTPCLPFDDQTPTKQMIACTRSFGSRITSLEGLAEAVGAYAANVSEKARRQQSLVACLQVFIQTSWFAPENERYRAMATAALPYPSSDTRCIAGAAQEALRRIYKPGYAYAKAGVVLTQLEDGNCRTGDLFTKADSASSEALMSTMDLINRKMGRGSLRFARVKPEPGWGMRQQFLSPSYMADWGQLRRVKC